MSLEIDYSLATKVLNDSLKRCSKNPVTSCLIKDTIDFVLNGKNCLTYRYIMFTALLAKAVNPNIDILSLQVQDSSSGSYDPRTLAKKVVFPFQKDLLGNILDGSNIDPLVNNPGRSPRLTKNNRVAKGDPKKALGLLCDNLIAVNNVEDAKACIDYIVSVLIAEKASRDAKRVEINEAIRDKGMFSVQLFLDDLLNQGFGGSALVIATTVIYKFLFKSDEYTVEPHPVNQSGSSSRQFSDLDVFKCEKPFMGTELKDKPFTSSEVAHAAEMAYQAKASSLLFIAGRQSTIDAQPQTYFAEAKKEYAEKGMYVGITSIDSLMDIAFASHMEENPSDLMNAIISVSEEIGAIEAQIWIYKKMSEWISS